MPLFNNHKSQFYWLQIELIAQNVIGKNYKDAQKIGEHLTEIFEENLDAIYAYSFIEASIKGTKETARWLVDQSISHHRFNSEKAYTLGKMLAKWHQMESLKLLLAHWFVRDDLICDANFYYLLGRYYNGIDRIKEGASYIKSAIMEDPLAIDHIIALANHYENNHIQQYASKIWKTLALDPLIPNSYFHYKHVMCLYKIGKKQEALETCNRFLDEAEPDRRLIQLLSKIKDKAA